MSGSNKNNPDFRTELSALWPRLWRLGLSLSGRRDVADDLAQSACRRAIERWHQFTPGTRLDSWVFAILVSIWRNERRAAVLRQSEALSDASSAIEFVSDDNPETAYYYRQVVLAVGQLPEAQRETVMLVYVEGFSYAEAASALDIPIGTVMSRLAAARLRLAALLGEANSLRKKVAAE